MTNQPKIRTRCPSCGFSSLFIDDAGHIVCSSIECKEPIVEKAISALREKAKGVTLNPAPAPEATETWLDGAVRKERDEWKARAEKAELAFRMSIDEVRAAKDDEAAKFERETAARLLAALVTRGAPHIGQKETEPLLSLAKQMADHYFPAKERTS